MSNLQFDKVDSQYLSRADFCQFLDSEGADPSKLTLRFHAISNGLDAAGNGC